eukprot:TRINITY_DN921_c0_g1_i2.p1 TRINITY_DN921_c0_g1~~TRINITY_DN921_c0_g1_i2.p1  ORF type:complete len:233 (+),score=40.98 TRINITY_DN921_c0_g1_i2:16-714(+)
MSSLVQKLQSIFKSTYNRDKLAKFIQYYTKFLAYFKKDIQNNEVEAKRMDSISSQVSFGRKLFRLGRFVHEYDELYTFFTKNMHKAGLNEWLNTLKLISLSSYWIFDILFWATTIGINRNGNIDRHRKTSVVFWFLSALFAFVQSILKLKSNLRNLQLAIKQNNQNSIVSNKNERVENVLNTTKCGFDMLLSFSFCIEAKLLPQFYTPTSREIGLFGTISGIADLILVWRKA